MYIVTTLNSKNKLDYHHFDTLILAQNFIKGIKHKYKEVILYQRYETKDWSRYRFEFDEENAFNREDYRKIGWSETEIDSLAKVADIPSFYIINLDDPNDERDCGPEGWSNSMEMCYEAPSGMSVEEAKQFLLDLGMIEGIPPHEERF